MNDRKRAKVVVAIIPILAVLTQCIGKYGNQLQEKNLLIPLVIALFVGAFGVLLWQSIQQWKKSDKEVVSDYLPLSGLLFTSDTKKTKTLVLCFLGTVAFVIFIMIKMRNGSPEPYILCGIALLSTGLPLLGALLGWNRGISDEQTYREGALAAILVGFFTSGFFCFFVGIGIWHGAWWFVCPPGLIFLSYFTRPLVAGLRILFRREKDPGEKHISKRKDSDPWDRPDRKL